MKWSGPHGKINTYTLRIDKPKWSDRPQRIMQNKYVHPIGRQAKMVRFPSGASRTEHVHSEDARTRKKRSGHPQPHRSIQKYHVHTEDEQTSRNSQDILTGALLKTTYLLRMGREAKAIRTSSGSRPKQSRTY